MLSFDEAKEKALRAISVKRYTKKELADKLKKQGVSEEVSEDVVAWATEYGFLNDVEYAKSYILNALNVKKQGLRKIKFELEAKGIDRFLFEDVVFELEGDNGIDEEKNIMSLLEKRLKDINNRKEIDKTVRFLISRGFDYGKIKKCVASYVNDFDLGDEDFAQ